MSAKDSQFIERALVHPWMFWVFFWKWPRILRQVCGEYDLVAKDRDAAKAAHEQAVAANEKVRKWIHVTHQLDATADLRAIWTAGKRLSILLLFFVVTNAFGQAPPYLRNQWTTNANPLALKVISTNGVRVATNVWELDFTNTATVTVSAVSNASKVMVSFTGSASGGSDSLWTNVPSGNAELGSILTPVEQYGMFQLATNSLVFWGDFSSVLAIGYPAVDVEQIGTNAVSIIFIGDYAGDSTVISNEAKHVIGIGGGALRSALIDSSSSLILALGGDALRDIHIKDSSRIVGVGADAMNNARLVTQCAYITAIGPGAFANSIGTNLNYSLFAGPAAAESSRWQSAQGISSFGLSCLNGAQATNVFAIMAFGNYSGENTRLTNAADINFIGNYTGDGASLTHTTNSFAIGYETLKNAIVQRSGGIFAVDYHAMFGAVLTNCNYVLAIGPYAGTNSALTNSFALFNYGYAVGQKQVALNSTSIYNYGTFAGSNQIVNGASRYYTYGANSGAASAVTNSTDIYGFGSYALRGASIHSSDRIFGVDYGALDRAVLTNCHAISGYGYWSLWNAILTDSRNITAIGYLSGTNLTLTGISNVVMVGNIGTAVPATDDFYLGRTNNVYRFPGNIGTIRGVSGYSWPTAHAAGVWTNDGAGITGWKPLSDFGGGSGIGSIFTNNVLAGGPGLTELGFTNSATVTVESTTNAGRVTVSFTSSTGSGIATNSGTGWDTSFRSVSTNTVPLRVESEAGLRLTNFVQVATNGGIPFFVVSSNQFVGIGTNAPKANLHIRNSSGGQLKIADATAGYTTITFWESATPATDYAFLGASFSDPTTYFNRSSGGDIQFREGNNGAAQMILKSSTGNAGIGTNSPISKLHVHGLATAVDGFASYATNRVTITATGYTNTMTVNAVPVNVDIYFDAATAALSDPAGNTLHTFQAGTNITVHLKPNWRLVGTAMAGTVIAH